METIYSIMKENRYSLHIMLKVPQAKIFDYSKLYFPRQALGTS